MKQLWVKVDPYKKKLVTTALESGADAVWVPAGRTAEVKSLVLSGWWLRTVTWSRPGRPGGHGYQPRPGSGSSAPGQKRPGGGAHS